MSIFCLNSCLTLGLVFAVESYISEHQLFQPDSKYFYDDVKYLFNKITRKYVYG